MPRMSWMTARMRQATAPARRRRINAVLRVTKRLRESKSLSRIDVRWLREEARQLRLTALEQLVLRALHPHTRVISPEVLCALIRRANRRYGPNWKP